MHPHLRQSSVDEGMRRASAFDPTLLRIDTMVAVRDIHLKDNFTLDEWVSSLTLSRK